MASLDPNQISQIAHVWKNDDPKLYEKFLRLFDQYTLEVTVAVTEAPNDGILQAQGRAQQMIKLQRLFTETKPTP